MTTKLKTMFHNDKTVFGLCVGVRFRTQSRVFFYFFEQYIFIKVFLGTTVNISFPREAPSSLAASHDSGQRLSGDQTLALT